MTIEQHKPLFKINEEIYAIALTDLSKAEDDLNFARIFKGYINSIHVYNDYIEYGLTDASNKEWGEVVEEKYISKEYTPLLNILINLWEINK